MLNNNEEKIHIYADKHIYELTRFLQKDFKISTYSNQLDFTLLSNYDVLFIRTVTKITKEIISKLPDSIRCIGTASAGFDHVDTEALRKKGISFYSAAGCNATAVAEYIQINLIWWSYINNQELSSKSIAIIGVGNVGKQVAKVCERLGLTTILYDPPRQKIDPLFKSAEFAEVLQADILSFHTPLNDSTKNYFSEKLFGQTEFDLVINAARGGILDENYLLTLLKSYKVKSCIIDCWQNEPEFNSELLAKSFVGTPHIAGYSEQAKLLATAMIFDQLNHDLGRINYHNEKFIETRFKFEHIEGDLDFKTILSKLHNFLKYDELLRQLLIVDEANRINAFSNLRVTLPYRNEFRFFSVSKEILKKFPILNSINLRSL
jgi:erythronate-4-phosphate dehydrogenase